MKKHLLSISLVASAMFLFSNCSKDDSSPAASSGNFSPLTSGSSWTYKYSEGTSASNNITVTVTNRDTVVGGKTYKVLTSSDGTTSYLAKTGSDYYRFGSFPSVGINSFEELYLKDNKGVNETWTSVANFVFSGQNIAANLTYTIKEKGVTRTVNGNVFNNVTHVRLDISIAGNVLGGGEFFYQDGVGLIEDSILVTPPFGSAYTSKEEIVSYNIK